MKALIINSGIDTRMNVMTTCYPKCLMEVNAADTVLSRQLRLICEAGIEEVVMTTGYYDRILEEYCKNLRLPLRFTFVKNPVYDCTNNIYSIYLARKYLDDDILFMHGDLVFERTVFENVVSSNCSCMTVSSVSSLPDKGLKVVVENERIIKIGTGYFVNAYAAQPLYKILKKQWKKWLDGIIEFCESGKTECYAEKAFNKLSDICYIMTLDIGNRLCSGFDNPEELYDVSSKLYEIENSRQIKGA